MKNKQKSGGELVLECLELNGVNTAYCVPGESYLDVLDAFIDKPDINLVTCRQEGGAAYMAEAYAKLTGNVGICFVTRGPGACNASIGVHTAKQDSTPMILFVGQVARDQMDKESFQEVDYLKMFAPPMSKWVTQVNDVDKIPEIINKAFKIATSGRPGPVVIALPEDVLTDKTKISKYKKLDRVETAASKDKMYEFKEMLKSAKKPIVIIGGSKWSDSTINSFETFSKKHNIPVVTSFRRQDLFNNRHANYIGELGTGPNPVLLKRLKGSDLIILLGTRFSEIASQNYSIIGKQKLIHIHPDIDELGKIYQPDLAILADVSHFITNLNFDIIDKSKKWKPWVSSARNDYLQWTTFKDMNNFDLDMNYIFSKLRTKIGKSAIITSDAGNFSGWAQRYLRYSKDIRLLAPTNGSMGYAVPAAIAASIDKPKKLVVALVGDGGFLMNGQEVATAMQNGAKPIILIFNNGIYGTIRMHQEMHYPKRVSGTDLLNPNFAELAKSFGANGYQIRNNMEFDDIFDHAIKSDKLTVIELLTSPDQITTSKKMSEL